MKPEFQLGKIIVELQAQVALLEAGQDVLFFLDKHQAGDFGETRRDLAEQGIRNRTWVRSQFRTLKGREIGVITFFEKGETVVSAPAPIVEPSFLRTNMIYDASEGKK